MDLISSYPSDTRILGFVPHTSEVASLTRVQAGDAWCVLRWNFLEKRMEASVKLRNSADLQGPHGISPDWREAAIGDTSGIVHFWDLETGEERRKLRAHDDGVRRMMWSPNGKYFVTADYSGDVTTWNSENWAHQAAMPHFEGFITAIRFSPDSQQLFVSKWGGVESWVADSFEKVGSPPRGGYGVCAFSPDYKTICLDVEQGVTLVTAGTWKTVLLFPDKTQCASAEFSPDGRYLGTRSRLGIVTMREAPSLEEINLMSGRPGVEAYYAPVLRYAVPGLEVPGIITTWQVSGAYRRDGLRLWGIFDVEFEPETTPDEAEWRAIDSKDPILDLGELWQGTQRVAYLRTIIQAFVEAEARLELGSDDGIKVWLNSELVHANNVGRGHRFAEDVVDVRLKKGTNTLMLKVTQGTGRWVTSARLIGRDGEPLEGVTFSNKF
jgi:hypothetical protein